MADQQPPEQSASYLSRLREGEQQWAWKIGMRAAIIILDLIGIGCAAWLLATVIDLDYYSFYDYTLDNEIMPFVLPAMSLSLIWCLICVLVFFLRRPPSPVHPGAAVGIDLVLWLILVCTGVATIGCIYDTAYFGSGGYIDDPSSSSNYDGGYYLKPNGTWVYNVTYVDSSYGYGGYNGGYTYNYTTGTYTYNTTRSHNKDVKRNCKPAFDTCAEQDAYINKLWQQRTRREATEIVTAAVQWLGVILHFILFVWACADTHKRNHRLKESEIQAGADRIIQDMRARGMITLHDPNVPSSAVPETSQPEQEISPIGVAR